MWRWLEAVEALWDEWLDAIWCPPLDALVELLVDWSAREEMAP
jgi:hypothetical protein